MTAGLAICDTLTYLKPAVSTVCLGQCSGMAALIFALGKQGKRFALTGSHFTLTPLTGGQRPEDAPVIERMRQDVTERLARATGQPVEQVQRDGEAERHLSALEARHYGLVDQVIEKTPDPA